MNTLAIKVGINARRASAQNAILKGNPQGLRITKIAWVTKNTR
jgi:hypothetical protein